MDDLSPLSEKIKEDIADMYAAIKKIRVRNELIKGEISGLICLTFPASILSHFKNKITLGNVEFTYADIGFGSELLITDKFSFVDLYNKYRDYSIMNDSIEKFDREKTMEGGSIIC